MSLVGLHLNVTLGKVLLLHKKCGIIIFAKNEIEILGNKIIWIIENKEKNQVWPVRLDFFHKLYTFFHKACFMNIFTNPSF